MFSNDNQMVWLFYSDLCVGIGKSNYISAPIEPEVEKESILIFMLLVQKSYG
jgi:hypothetical protein